MTAVPPFARPPRAELVVAVAPHDEDADRLSYADLAVVEPFLRDSSGFRVRLVDPDRSPSRPLSLSLDGAEALAAALLEVAAAGRRRAAEWDRQDADHDAVSARYAADEAAVNAELDRLHGTSA